MLVLLTALFVLFLAIALWLTYRAARDKRHARHAYLRRGRIKSELADEGRH